MENIKYGRRREGRWTPIRAKAQDTRANPNSSETHLVRKRWDIGLLRALNPRIMMMMMIYIYIYIYIYLKEFNPIDQWFPNCERSRGFLRGEPRTVTKSFTI